MLSCKKCGTALLDGNRYAQSLFCRGCVCATAPASPTQPNAEVEAAPAALAQPAAGFSPAVDEAAVKRISELANGHAVSIPPAAPAGRDEESATVARIAAMANGAAPPTSQAGDAEDAEMRAFGERMRQHDERLVAEQRRVGG